MDLNTFQDIVNPLLFSHRRMALDKLQLIARDRIGLNVPWPELILLLQDSDFETTIFSMAGILELYEDAITP